MIYILDVLGNNIRSQELPAVCILSAEIFKKYIFNVFYESAAEISEV